MSPYQRDLTLMAGQVMDSLAEQAIIFGHSLFMPKQNLRRSMKVKPPPANFTAAIQEEDTHRIEKESQEEASFSRQPLDAGSGKETTGCWIAPTFDTNVKAKYENPDMVSDLTAIPALAASVPSAEQLAKKLSQHHEDGGLWHERQYGYEE